MSSMPRVAVSMGDPSGIGAEVTVAALQRRTVRRRLTPILIGDLGVYQAAAALRGVRLRFAAWEPPAPLPTNAIAVRIVSALSPRQRQPGRPTPGGGQAAYAAVLEAVQLVRHGFADALATAPLCKANLQAAGRGPSGHTELLAELCHTPAVRMMMVGPHLRVALVTTHLALRAVPGALSQHGVLETLRITDRALRQRFGLPGPRLGVAGLNPHAGEGGLFGDEDARIIAPAVRAARRHHINASGPLAADGLFAQAIAGRYDAVVCMYHDQGLGPFKLIHFADGVNFTAGLPLIRTSPDHGTAHDIAGRGTADPSSMAAALNLAASLSSPPDPR